MSDEQYESGLRKLQAELAAWRQGRRGPGGRLPERFWNSAMTLVEYSSAETVAAATGLSAQRLRDRGAVGPSPAPSFVEFLLPSTGKRCTIKVEAASGARMQCEIDGLDTIGLATIIKEFAR